MVGTGSLTVALCSSVFMAGSAEKWPDAHHVHGSGQLETLPQSLWPPKPQLVIFGETQTQRLSSRGSCSLCSDRKGNEWATWSPSSPVKDRGNGKVTPHSHLSLFSLLAGCDNSLQVSQDARWFLCLRDVTQNPSMARSSGVLSHRGWSLG